MRFADAHWRPPKVQQEIHLAEFPVGEGDSSCWLTPSWCWVSLNVRRSRSVVRLYLDGTTPGEQQSQSNRCAVQQFFPARGLGNRCWETFTSIGLRLEAVALFRYLG